MKNVKTAAIVAFFYVLITFLLDIFNWEVALFDIPFVHLFTGYVINFLAYLLGAYLVHALFKIIHRKKVG